MCRMFAYVGSSRKDMGRLYSALKEAARCDNTLKGMEGMSHDDGWGCVILNGGRLVHYRSIKPVYSDGAFAMPEIDGTTYAIFHARKASNSSPKGLAIFSHPFVAVTESAVLFMAHNGGLQSSEIPVNTVDSELALKKIVEAGSLTGAKAALEQVTGSALNLLLLSVEREGDAARMEYLNHWNGEERSSYYRMYYADMEGGRAVFSSTMAERIEGKECERGSIARL